jgi:hypothetical protein
MIQAPAWDQLFFLLRGQHLSLLVQQATLTDWPLLEMVTTGLPLFSTVIVYFLYLHS